jgi:hypothetical protein
MKVNNLREYVYVFKNIKNVLNHKFKHIVYYTFIQSIITYGIAF